jgi:DNA polymerase IV
VSEPIIPPARSRPDVPTILHVDMDAFFASVEVLDDPSLAGKPVIVGGAGARGVVASCTYEARQYGVHSAMPSLRARQLRPEAVFLSGRHSRYAEVSAALQRILHDVTPMVEPIGLDEAFMDVAGALRLLGPPDVIAHGLRERVRDEMQLRCAVGIGRSKMIAKLASRAAKPRATRHGLEPGPGVYLVRPEDERAFLHGHDVEALWGVGPATAKRLHDLGVRTVGELAALPPDTLVRRLGKSSGAHLAALARGDDPEPVRPNRPTKSIGHEETFSQDLVDPAELERHALRMAESVATMLRGEGSSCRTVTVKVKFRDFSLQTRSHTLDRPITTGTAIGQVAAALLAGIDPGEGIRLLGVSASGLHEGGADQLSFDLGDGLDQASDSPVAREQSWQDVTATVDAIRTRFGKSSVGSAAHVTTDGVVVPARRDAPWGPDE